MDNPDSRNDRLAPPTHVPAAAGGGPAPGQNHQAPDLVDFLWFNDVDQLTAPMRAFLTENVGDPIEFPLTDLAPAWLHAAVEQQHGRRHAPNEHDGAWRHAERRQAKRQESDTEASERATKASLAFLTAERALSDWRLALLELTRAHASVLIAMILKMLVRISTAPFHQRLQMMDTLKEPLHSTSTDEQRLEHVSFLLDGISQNSDQLVGVVEVLDRVLGRVAGVVAKAPRTPTLRLLVRFLQLGLPAFTNTGLGTGFLLHDYLRGVFATVLRKEYDALPSDLPLPQDLVDKFTKSLTPLAADLLAALAAFPADCHFTLAGGATASAHSLILRQRCPLLEAQRAHPSVPPAVFDVILKYLYTDCISIASTRDPVLTDVMTYAGTLQLYRLEGANTSRRVRRTE